MRKKIKEIGRMLGKLKPFLAPYALQLFVSVFMIVISIGAITAAPRIEGMITSRLAADLADMASGAEGARIHFEVIRNILLMLLAIYLTKTVSQIVGS